MWLICCVKGMVTYMDEVTGESCSCGLVGLDAEERDLVWLGEGFSVDAAIVMSAVVKENCGARQCTIFSSSPSHQQDLA